MSQGDLLMKRKLQQMVERQQQQHQRTLSTFSFTDQFIQRPTETRAVDVPDNWTTADELAGTGSYFSMPRARPAPSPTQLRAPQQQPAATLGATASSGAGDRRLTPAERQQMLNDVVQQRVALALEEQQEEDRARLARCQVQREVERLKLHQRTRARIELQAHAGQSIADRVAPELGADLAATAHDRTQTTLASQVKAHLRDEPQRQFVAHNIDRMERNLQHREYCLEAMRERAAARRELEETVGTYHARKTAKLLGTMSNGGATTAATTHASASGATSNAATTTMTRGLAPTAEELHMSRVQTAKERERAAADRAELEAERRELAELDEFLWSDRRSQKGAKAARVRELPFSLSAPYRREANRDATAPPSIKLPNLGAWKQQSVS